MAEKIVDSWRALIAAQPHLAKWFFAPNGKPDGEYKAAVKSALLNGLERLRFDRMTRRSSTIKKKLGCGTPCQEKRNRASPDSAAATFTVPAGFRPRGYVDSPF